MARSQAPTNLQVRQVTSFGTVQDRSGVNAVLAASRSLEVLAVDINPHALAAAQDNAARNGVADRIR